jgi:hypothetical protein
MQVGDAVFWISLIGALAISFRLFRDLADLSQWIIKTPRNVIMATFYNRHVWATAFVLLWLLATVIQIKGAAGYWPGYLIISAAALFMTFSGYINPSIMMRAQPRSGRFVTIEMAKSRVNPDESVIVIEANGGARAHPDYQILRPHIAGTAEGLGGENVVMTYCGLTHMGIAYKPEVGGKELDLGVMTQLENNLVMFDKITGEPIQQFWGTLEKDGKAGPAMPQWPSFRMPFKAFAQAFPDGKVFVNPIPTFAENPFLAIYDPLMDMIFRHGINDQAIKERPTFPTIDHFDDRLPNKTKIFGVNVGDDYVAYTLNYIKSASKIINTEIGGRAIAIYYDPTFDSVGMYYNTTGKNITKLDFYGKQGARKLERVETMKSEAYWVVWANFFPTTDLNRGPAQQNAA